MAESSAMARIKQSELEAIIPLQRNEDHGCLIMNVRIGDASMKVAVDTKLDISWVAQETTNVFVWTRDYAKEVLRMIDNKRGTPQKMGAKRIFGNCVDTFGQTPVYMPRTCQMVTNCVGWRFNSANSLVNYNVFNCDCLWLTRETQLLNMHVGVAKELTVHFTESYSRTHPMGALGLADAEAEPVCLISALRKRTMLCDPMFALRLDPAAKRDLFIIGKPYGDRKIGRQEPVTIPIRVKKKPMDSQWYMKAQIEIKYRKSVYRFAKRYVIIDTSSPTIKIPSTDLSQLKVPLNHWQHDMSCRASEKESENLSIRILPKYSTNHKSLYLAHENLTTATEIRGTETRFIYRINPNNDTSEYLLGWPFLETYYCEFHFPKYGDRRMLFYKTS